MSGSSVGPGFNNPSTAFPANVEMEPAPPPFLSSNPEFTSEGVTRDAQNLAAHLSTLTIEQHAQYVAHFASILELASQNVEMPPVDRKGKGKAKE
jgi:hypothetical protein